MSAARVDSDGTVTQLDRGATPGENLSEQDVADVPKLTRLLIRLVADVAALKRRFWPARLDFEDLEVDGTGTVKYRFEHGFGGRARWWVVSTRATSGVSAMLEEHADTDQDTLVLVSYSACTIDLRVEQAG